MTPRPARLAVWIGGDVDERLRLLAHTRRQRLGHLLTELLDKALPSVQELADQLGGAIDVTFIASKSISLLAAAGDGEDGGGALWSRADIAAGRTGKNGADTAQPEAEVSPR